MRDLNSWGWEFLTWMRQGDLQGGGGGQKDASSTVSLSFAPLRLMLSTEPTLGSTEH